jgi:hypothetical protein
MMSHQNQILNLKNNGLIFYKNFLSNKEIEKLTKIINKHLYQKQDPRGYFLVNNIQLFKNLLKFNFSKILESFTLINLANNKKMNEFADSFFEKKSSLKKIDCYYTPINNKDNIEWHNDLAPQPNFPVVKDFKNYGNRYLKFFIYLTKVGPDNGCTSYIPGSHKIIYALCDGMAQKKIDYVPFFSLTDVRNALLIKKNYEFLKKYLSHGDIVDNFLDETKFIEYAANTSKFDFSMDPGDAIIFDDVGIHRASKTKNERIVLRFLYGKK